MTTQSPIRNLIGQIFSLRYFWLTLRWRCHRYQCSPYDIEIYLVSWQKTIIWISWPGDSFFSLNSQGSSRRHHITQIFAKKRYWAGWHDHHLLHNSLFHKMPDKAYLMAPGLLDDILNFVDLSFFRGGAHAVMVILNGV